MSTEVLSSRVWRLPPSLPDNIAAFEKNVSQFKAETISPTQFQVFRVPQGVYEQRESGTYMLRVRFPAGVALPHQLCKLAEVSQKHANGVLHVTTRQDVQLHRVLVDAIHPALTLLAEAGLSTKGGGGNTVRNITGCPHAGVCANEAFDVTPHVLALTEFLLPDPQSFQLPRKFKIAFSGCGADSAGATIHDVGLIAKKRDEAEGFAVYIGGGLGSGSRVGDLFEEFIPSKEIPMVVEAIKRVFNTQGNRKDRRQARLRFLIRQIGLDGFRKLYAEQLANLRSQSLKLPELKQSVNTPTAVGTPSIQPSGNGDVRYDRWLAANAKPQKQPGVYRVEIPLPLGDISAEKLIGLARIVEQHGERLLRATQKQNFTLRWVKAEELPMIFQALEKLALGTGLPPVLRDMVACTGAANCRLGICLSRGVAQGVSDTLSRSRTDLHALGKVQLNISGCPNSCGRHQIADIGMYGAARRVDGRLVPHYVVQFGGHVEEGKTELATGRHIIAARHVPAFIDDLLDTFARSPEQPDFRAFVRASAGQIDELVARYSQVPLFKDDRNFYYDWGAEELFSLAGRGPGECGAGVLDLIEVDLKNAAESLQENRLFQATTLAARALLVTRGEQANNDREAFTLFQKLFIDAGLVDSQVQPIVSSALTVAGTADAAAVYAEPRESVAAFVNTIQELFKSMDATLQFPRKTSAVSPPAPAVAVETKANADVEKDFRGVVCPLNYVKTKMALSSLKVGQTLSVLLDEQGGRNVPESAEKDGQEIVAIKTEGSYTQVIIRKIR